ncbi:MAG: hypothetical protein ACQEVA_03470 [Myxococcota bacterium]
MSDPKEILERRLENVATRDETRGLHFFCQIGGHDDELGMTTLQISGSGYTLLSWKQTGESELFHVELSADDMEKFYGILVEHPFWDASPTRRKRQEGETNVHMRFADQGKGLYSMVQFWSDDIEKFPVLGRLLDRVIHVIRVVSEDSIPYLELPDTR